MVRVCVCGGGGELKFVLTYKLPLKWRSNMSKCFERSFVILRTMTWLNFDDSKSYFAWVVMLGKAGLGQLVNIPMKSRIHIIWYFIFMGYIY